MTDSIMEQLSFQLPYRSSLIKSSEVMRGTVNVSGRSNTLTLTKVHSGKRYVFQSR